MKIEDIKVGKKYRIRKDLKGGRSYGGVYFSRVVAGEFCGEVGMVTRIVGENIYMDNMTHWTWSAEMLEPYDDGRIEVPEVPKEACKKTIGTDRRLYTARKREDFETILGTMLGDEADDTTLLPTMERQKFLEAEFEKEMDRLRLSKITRVGENIHMDKPKRDKIVQVFLHNKRPVYFGLSESGKLYRLDLFGFPVMNLDGFEWKLIIESPLLVEEKE